jgi:hypothetical protein
MRLSASKIFLVALGLTALLAISPSARSQTRPTVIVPQPVPSKNVPNSNVPSGLNGPAVTTPDGKAIDKQNQVEMQAQIEKLYALAFELREQMKAIDAANTLSVDVVRRAREIEKLAKDIKDRAKH